MERVQIGLYEGLPGCLRAGAAQTACARRTGVSARGPKSPSHAQLGGRADLHMHRGTHVSGQICVHGHGVRLCVVRTPACCLMQGMSPYVQVSPSARVPEEGHLRGMWRPDILFCFSWASFVISSFTHSYTKRLKVF